MKTHNRFLMRRQWRSLLYTALICLSTASTYAKSTLDPYTVHLAHKGTVQETYEHALEQVLTRATGSVAVLQQPEIKTLLQNPKPLITSIQHIDNQMKITFSEVSIGQYLREYEIPVWERIRPNIALWLLIDHEHTYMPSINDQSDWSYFVQHATEQFALNLQLPSKSALKTISPTDLKGGFFKPIQDTYHQEHPDAILIAKATKPMSGTWKVSWELRSIQESQKHLNLSGVSQGVAQEAIFDMIQEISSYLSSLFTINQTSLGQLITIRIEQVQDLQQITTTEKKLAQLSLVKGVTLLKIGHNWVEFQLQTLGSVQNLQHTLALVPELKIKANDDKIPNYVYVEK